MQAEVAPFLIFYVNLGLALPALLLRHLRFTVLDWSDFDLATDQAHLRGIVVPGFALNNVLSNVPLLGPLLTGGKDGGVFAIAYRLDGPLADLKTDVNMMSAMTPGALRDLFTAQPDPSYQPQPSQEMQRAP